MKGIKIAKLVEASFLALGLLLVFIATLKGYLVYFDQLDYARSYVYQTQYIGELPIVLDSYFLFVAILLVLGVLFYAKNNMPKILSTALLAVGQTHIFCNVLLRFIVRIGYTTGSGSSSITKYELFASDKILFWGSIMLFISIVLRVVIIINDYINENKGNKNIKPVINETPQVEKNNYVEEKKTVQQTKAPKEEAIKEEIVEEIPEPIDPPKVKIVLEDGKCEICGKKGKVIGGYFEGGMGSKRYAKMCKDCFIQKEAKTRLD